MNTEAESQKLSRYTNWAPEPRESKAANGDKAAKDSVKLHPLTPIAANGDRPKATEKGRDGAVRFMLDPECADAEKSHVSEYFKVEMEEYEVEE